MLFSVFGIQNSNIDAVSARFTRFNSVGSGNPVTTRLMTGGIIAIVRAGSGYSRKGLYMRDAWNTVGPIVEMTGITFTLDGNEVTISNTASGSVTVTIINPV